MTALQRQGEPAGTRQLLADSCLGRLTAPDACRWALSALEAGFDTPSLRILAGMFFDPLPGFFEVRPYLDGALRELNISVSSRDEVLREYARARSLRSSLLGCAQLKRHSRSFTAQWCPP